MIPHIVQISPAAFVIRKWFFGWEYLDIRGSESDWWWTTAYRDNATIFGSADAAKTAWKQRRAKKPRSQAKFMGFL